MGWRVLCLGTSACNCHISQECGPRHTQTCTSTHSHAQTHRDMHRHAWTCSDNKDTHEHTWACIYTLENTSTCTDTHGCTHTQILTQTHTSRDTNRLQVKGWKELCHENSNQKRARMAILLSDKVHFKSKIL